MADIHAAVEANHKRQYEAALESAQHTGPAWEDLTEEQRINIRRINNEHTQFMNALGNAIATGGPLPALDLKA